MPRDAKNIPAAIVDYLMNAYWFCVLAVLISVLSGCSAQQSVRDKETDSARNISRHAPDPVKVKAAVARWEQWLHQSDPDLGAVKFRCDLRKTDSLMSPYVATCGYWFMGGDVEIEHTFSLQDGKWVFTKGTWTAHHYDGRIVVKEIHGGAEREKLEVFLNE